MFASALKAAHKLSSGIKDSDSKELTLPSECLPENYTFEQLYHGVIGDKVPRTEVLWEQLTNPSTNQQTENELPKLLVISRCLSDIAQQHEKVDVEDDLYKDIVKLTKWIQKAMLPKSDLIPHDEMPEDSKLDIRQLATLNAQRRGEEGIRALKSVFEISPTCITNSGETMVCILAFTSPLDPWTTLSSFTLAKSFLSLPGMAKAVYSTEIIRDYVMKDFIRFLFSKSRLEGITAAGRKAMPSSAPRKAFDVNELEKAARPWKYDVPFAITVLEHAFENIPPEAIVAQFHLFVPPLLTLLDESSTPIRVRALSMLLTFLSALNSKLLSQTGLGSVFEDALLPILHYLPTLTPIEESLQLLPAAYKSLFTLFSVRYLSPSTPASTTTLTINTPHQSNKTDIDISPTARLSFLDRLMRQGILTSYLHASNYALIVEILLTQLITLIPLLGIHVTKHLPHLLPIITSTLSDPFSTALPSLLLAAAKTLQALLLNAWPRMREQSHRVGVVGALVACWVNMGMELNGTDEGAKGSKGNVKAGKKMELEEVKVEIRIVGRMLVKAVGVDGSLDFAVELAPLLEHEKGLGEVFGFDVI